MNEILNQELLNEVKNETEKMRQLRYELQARIKNFLQLWREATNYEFDNANYDDVVLFELSTMSHECKKEYIIARNRNYVYLRIDNYDDYEYEQKDLQKLNFERILQIAKSIPCAVREHIEFLKSKNQEYEKLLQVYEKFQVKKVDDNEEVKA